MASEQTISTAASDDLRERIQAYQDRRGLDYQSEAIRELLETGLEESSPILSRIKTRAIDALYHLTLVAAVLAITSLTTELLTVPTGLQVGAIMIAIGVAGVAAVELIRVVSVGLPQHLEVWR